MNLVSSMATREPFLRRFRINPNFHGYIAHWNLEVSQQTLLGWYDKLEMTPEQRDRCFPLHLRGNLSLNFDNDAVVDWTVKWLRDRSIKVWVIDPLSKLFREEENNSTEFNRWWLRLEHIAREADLRLVVLVHHTGHANQRSRGTSAMMGNPDVLLDYTHNGELGKKPPDNIRYLEAFGRDVHLPASEIDFEPETNTLFCTNSGKTREEAKRDRKARHVGVEVWNVPDRLKTGDLYELLGWSQKGNSSKENTQVVARAEQLQYIARCKDGTTTWNMRGTVDPRTPAEKAKGAMLKRTQALEDLAESESEISDCEKGEQ